MVARTPRSARRAPAHPVPAASSAGAGDSHRTGDSHPSRHAGRPRARRAEGTESVPRQRTRGHQLLPGLKGRGAARGTRHPGAGERRGMSPCQDGAVLAAAARPCTAEPEGLRRKVFLWGHSRGLAGRSHEPKLLSPAFCRSEVGARPFNTAQQPQEQGDPHRLTSQLDLGLALSPGPAW